MYPVDFLAHMSGRKWMEGLCYSQKLHHNVMMAVITVKVNTKWL